MPSQTNRPYMIEPDYGVSEVVGSILLISLVILGVTVVGMFMFSEKTPQNLPSVNFMTGNDNNNNLYLFHNGGDSLTSGTFSVVIDGNPREASIVEGGNQWSLGKTLKITGIDSNSKHSIALIYNATSGGPVVLRSANSSTVVPSSLMGNPDISTYPPMISTSNLMQNITGASVNYYREGGTFIKFGTGYIQFNITKMNSSIWYSNSSTITKMQPLNIGSRVRITPYTISGSATSSPGIRVFGIGDQIWELTAENATVSVINPDNSVNSPGAGKFIVINHTWITGYSNFQSTLNLTSTSGTTYFTELVDNTYTSYSASQTFSSQVINAPSSKVVELDNVRPAGTGLFVLQYDNKTQSMYFVGRASYTVTP